MSPIFRRTLVLSLLFATIARAGDQPLTVNDALALQESLRQGRELLSRGETAKAVELLEKQLGKIRGDAAFLATLKEAYQTYIKELQLANKVEALEVYRKRLAVLDRNATFAPPKREVARGVRPDDDPFQQQALEAKANLELVGQAEKAFTEKRFSEARTLFANAGPLNVAQQSQYAYCILHGVVERNNTGQASAADLQRDVRAALALAPQDTQLAKFGQQLLQQVGERSDTPETVTSIRHGEAGNGWRKSESTNFRLLHAQEPAYAEQLLRAAEQHRTAFFSKWTNNVPGNWEPICEICLHVNGASYAQATGQSASSPGHSSIKMPGGKVTARRIELRADHPDMAMVTLPHEITHVVLADIFPDGSLPRWADEGMAVLSEPRAQVDRYLKTMIRLRNERKLIPLNRILDRTEYPDAATVTVFYVESVSVVEFMVNQKGTAEFVQFLKDARSGFEPALQQHYGLQSISQLEEAWRRASFPALIERWSAVGQ
jgi:hypothetical protein